MSTTLLNSVLSRSPQPAQSVSSALPRPLDMTYPSNRQAVVGTALGVLGAGVLGASLPGSLRVGLSTFAAWAIARELDPDYPSSALGAMPLAFLGALGRPHSVEAGQREGMSTLRHILPAMSALSSTRILSATVGPALTAQDAGALSLQSALGALSGDRVGALLPGAALWVSGTFTDPHRPQAEWSAPAALAAGLAPSAAKGAGSSVLGDVLALAALGLGQQVVATEKVQGRCDVGGYPLSAGRLQASRILALGAVGLGLLRRETRSLAPLAAACLVVGWRRLAPKP